VVLAFTAMSYKMLTSSPVRLLCGDVDVWSSAKFEEKISQVGASLIHEIAESQLAKAEAPYFSPAHALLESYAKNPFSYEEDDDYMNGGWMDGPSPNAVPINFEIAKRILNFPANDSFQDGIVGSLKDSKQIVASETGLLIVEKAVERKLEFALEDTRFLEGSLRSDQTECIIPDEVTDFNLVGDVMSPQLVQGKPVFGGKFEPHSQLRHIERIQVKCSLELSPYGSLAPILYKQTLDMGVYDFRNYIEDYSVNGWKPTKFLGQCHDKADKLHRFVISLVGGDVYSHTKQKKILSCAAKDAVRFVAHRGTFAAVLPIEHADSLLHSLAKIARYFKHTYVCRFRYHDRKPYVTVVLVGRKSRDKSTKYNKTGQRYSVGRAQSLLKAKVRQFFVNYSQHLCAFSHRLQIYRGLPVFDLELWDRDTPDGRPTLKKQFQTRDDPHTLGWYNRAHDCVLLARVSGKYPTLHLQGCAEDCLFTEQPRSELVEEFPDFYRAALVIDKPHRIILKGERVIRTFNTVPSLVTLVMSSLQHGHVVKGVARALFNEHFNAMSRRCDLFSFGEVKMEKFYGRNV